MKDYKLTLDIEPESKYKKAEQDLLKAKKSFEELNDQEKILLLQNALGAEWAHYFMNLLKRSVDNK